ncbi:hypothetical protein JOD54_002184 [Actinokineospora baliensis]|uniref:phage tail assembly protein n=1 Tax=Actinokineospora baliensis TaxID=547056 RepID=UPI001958E1AF|nr:phage tail assembly protein [Actinokineospora baliensis]MBM7771980.1 hypothetical protein [Actinokineospora baliensis]
MPNIFTLSDLRADLDREFAPLTLDLGEGVVTLRNLMRVSEDERATVLTALSEVDELHHSEDDSTTTTPEDLARLARAVETILSVVAEPGRGDAVVRALGGDLMLSMKVMEAWAEATQPGEAQHSPS